MKRIMLCDDCQLERVAELSKKYKIGIEVQSFYDPKYPTISPDAIKTHQMITESITHKAIHGPFADLNFGSFDQLIQDVTRKRYEYAYEVAESLGCTDIVLHHGYVPKTTPYGSWLERGSAFWREFFINKDESIKIHIENLLEQDPNLISDLVTEVGDQRFDVCLDIGHAHCNSNTKVLDWIKQLKHQIGYVHMHSNGGIYDEHLGFGEGTLSMLEVCEALKVHAPEAVWAIETRLDAMESSIHWLQKNGFWK